MLSDSKITSSVLAIQTPARMKHIIFDLDGTIIDSKNEILKSYQLVFGKVPPKSGVNTNELNYGININDLLQSVYGDDIESRVVAKKLFASIYDTSGYEETHLYDGVFETLGFLRGAGHELYIATNKRYLPTVRILEAKKIKHLFSHIVGYEMQPGISLSKRDMVIELKRLGGFSEGFMVGDSIGDVQAGNDEQLTTIAVTYGYETEQLLAKCSPHYLIDSFSKILPIINK